MRSSSVPAIALAVCAGAGIALQAFINGRLGVSLGSPAYAAVANQAIGLAVLVVVAIGTGALRRSWQKMKASAGLRWWYLAPCLNGVVSITVAAAAAPKLGVALLAVSLVGGQCIGSLGADGLGLTPLGQRPLTLARLAGAVLAMASVIVAAVGAHARPHLTLLALAFIAGVGFPLSQAGVGQLTRVTGEPIAAGALYFAIACVGTVIVAIILPSNSGLSPGWLATPAAQWVGGLIGAGAVIIIAITVRILGALWLTLGIIAGQAIGGLVIDLVDPVRGQRVTVLTVVSVIVVLLALWISNVSAGYLATRRHTSIRKADACAE